MKRATMAGVSLLGLAFGATAVLWMARGKQADAHCQVPCGIYDDEARIAAMREDAATIAKAIKQMNEYAGKRDAQSINQATRWVTTKEAHASHIIETVSEYFLTQKVKPVAAGAGGYEAYLRKLADHHAVMVAAMKTKQHVDPATVDALQRAIGALASHYGK